MNKKTKALLLGSLVLPAVMMAGCGQTDKDYTVNFTGYEQGSYPTITVSDEGTKLYEPIQPTRTGYTFDGWFVGDKKWNFETDIVSSNMVLTAKWTPIEYTITYITNDGTVPESTPTTYTVEDTFTLATPTRAGYEFRGWYDGTDWNSNPNEGSTKYESIAKGSTSNLTLYARWDMYTLDGKLIVHNADRLKMLQDNLDWDAILTNDIDLNGAEWTPIGSAEHPYTGDFDGNGYTISNYKITEALANDIGFFAATANNTITDLTLRDFDINIVDAVDNIYIGGLTSIANNSTITNCHTAGTITANTSTDFAYWPNITITFVGGLVQQATTCTITQCSATNNITTKHGSEEVAVYAGGLVQEALTNTVIDQCFTSGTLTLNNIKGITAGGITRQLKDSTISNCYSLCDITAVCDFQNGTNIGGITQVGRNSTITNCYYDGTLSAINNNDDGMTANASGIIDFSYGSTTVSNCYVNGEIYASIAELSYDYNVSYACGVNRSISEDSSITNCYQSDTTTLSATAISEENAIIINHSTIASLADIYSNLQTVWDSDIWLFDGNNSPQLKAFVK